MGELVADKVGILKSSWVGEAGSRKQENRN